MTGVQTCALPILSDIELIDYILKRFHERHRDQLSSVLEDADKVVSVHGDHERCPRELARILREVAGELEAHMLKEERVLFPMICSGQGAYAVGPISVMSAEHEMHLESVAKLDAMTRDECLPEDACGTWRRLFNGVQELITDLRTHIEVENEILFARLQGLSLDDKC